MKKYKVLSDTGVSLDGELDIIHAKDEVFEADAEVVANIQALLDSGAIEEVVDEAPLPKEGDVCTLEDGSEGVINAEGVCVAKVAPAPAPAADESAAAVGGAVAANTEPRPRFRGQLVISHEPRTVGEQTFEHIRLEDGTEQDLTEAEFRTEVKIAYPPQK